MLDSFLVITSVMMAIGNLAMREPTAILPRHVGLSLTLITFAILLVIDGIRKGSQMKPNDVYAYIFDELETARREANKYDAMAQALRQKVTNLGGMLVLLRDETCMHCHGKGKVWHSYAQDDAKLEDCPDCKGTGGRDGSR